ncbi:hypothetical protein Tco_0617378 [Tanacetum coccineum]
MDFTSVSSLLNLSSGTVMVESSQPQTNKTGERHFLTRKVPQKGGGSLNEVAWSPALKVKYGIGICPLALGLPAPYSPWPRCNKFLAVSAMLVFKDRNGWKYTHRHRGFGYFEERLSTSSCFLSVSRLKGTSVHSNASYWKSDGCMGYYIGALCDFRSLLSHKSHSSGLEALSLSFRVSTNLSLSIMYTDSSNPSTVPKRHEINLAPLYLEGAGVGAISWVANPTKVCLSVARSNHASHYVTTAAELSLRPRVSRPRSSTTPAFTKRSGSSDPSTYLGQLGGGGGIVNKHLLLGSAGAKCPHSSASFIIIVSSCSRDSRLVPPQQQALDAPQPGIPHRPPEGLPVNRLRNKRYVVTVLVDPLGIMGGHRLMVNDV